MNATERFLAIYSESGRKKLDQVPSFVQYVKPEFISMHEEELFGGFSGDLYYNLRLDAPLVLGFDGVFSDIPHSISGEGVEVEDKQGQKHSIGLNGQYGSLGGFYHGGLLNSIENLDKVLLS